MIATHVPDAVWTDGLCLEDDHWTSNDNSLIALARHICIEHCPVLAECGVTTGAMPNNDRRSVVYAGIPYGFDGRPGDYPRPAPACGRCKGKSAPRHGEGGEWRERAVAVRRHRRPRPRPRTRRDDRRRTGRNRPLLPAGAGETLAGGTAT